MPPRTGKANLKERVLRLFFPPRCLACRARTPTGSRFDVVCDRCFTNISRLPWLRCPACGARRPQAGRPGTGKVGTECHGGTTLAAASPFGDPTVRELVHALKYRAVRRAALPLAALILEHLALVHALPEAGDPAALVPVPLHPRRERKRGYNQAALIAEALAALAPEQFSVATGALARVRDTAPQAKTVDRRTRRANVEGSFAPSSGAVSLGRRVFLVDDVATTGATLEAASRALRTAGVQSILCITAAVSERQ